jgi:hypothetical protein
VTAWGWECQCQCQCQLGGGYLFSGDQMAQRPAPKGLEDSAQGFNPGNHKKRFALKGREDRANETYYNDTLRSCG